MRKVFETDNITLYHGDVTDISDVSFTSLVTSPPYAEQHKKFYNGVSEDKYPAWTTDWMSKVKPLISDTGSCLINIRENISKGEISDYVLRTRLAVRESGWKECEELIWIKPDGPPVGNINRPRRSWERILWFSNTGKPNAYPKANGTFSKNISFRKQDVGQSLKQWGSGFTDDKEPQAGFTRCKDYVEISVSNNAKKEHSHPAAYPVPLAEWMLKLVSVEGDTILDPFSGSGTTGIAAVNNGRKYIGIDNSLEYLDMTIERYKKIGLI